MMNIMKILSFYYCALGVAACVLGGLIASFIHHGVAFTLVAPLALIVAAAEYWYSRNERGVEQRCPETLRSVEHGGGLTHEEAMSFLDREAPRNRVPQIDGRGVSRSDFEATMRSAGK